MRWLLRLFVVAMGAGAVLSCASAPGPVASSSSSTPDFVTPGTSASDAIRAFCGIEAPRVPNDDAETRFWSEAVVLAPSEIEPKVAIVATDFKQVFQARAAGDEQRASQILNDESFNDAMKNSLAWRSAHCHLVPTTAG